MLFISLLLAGFIFYFAPPRLTNTLQFAFVRVFCWPLSVGGNISLATSGLISSAQGSPEEVVSRARYDKLHNHLANVTEWLREERQKVEKLSGLRDRTAWQGVNFILADCVTTTVDGLHGELVVNRGTEDGLATGQFVMADDSIVGVIAEVGSRTARIRLITDPASKIAVRMEGLDAERIMQGCGGNLAKVRLVPKKLQVKKGEVVCAQKKPGFLSIPVIAGTVVECQSSKDNPLLWDITVEPACKISELTEVAVIVMNPRQ
jgi:rod shape-determining protein MreC